MIVFLISLLGGFHSISTQDWSKIHLFPLDTNYNSVFSVCDNLLSSVPWNWRVLKNTFLSTLDVWGILRKIRLRDTRIAITWFNRVCRNIGQFSSNNDFNFTRCSPFCLVYQLLHWFPHQNGPCHEDTTISVWCSS